MAGGLGLLGSLALGQIGTNYLADRRQAQRNELLQQGIQSALGTAPSAFDADLFPGEQPIPGLYNEGTGLRADPNDIGNQLDFAANIFGLPGGQEFAGDIFQNALGYAQQRYDRDRITEAGFEEQRRQMMQQQQQFDEGQRWDNFWNLAKLQQDQYEFEQGRVDDAAAAALKPPTGYQRALDQGVEVFDDTGQPLWVPQQNSTMWNNAKQSQDAYEESITVLDQLTGFVEDKGTEQLPGELKGRMQALSTMLTFAGKEIFGTGVLSDEDVRLIQQAAADPTKLLSSQNRSQILGAYSELLGKLQRGLRRHNQNTAYWPGLGSDLDKMTPRQIQRQAEIARAQEQAQGMGLVDQPPPAAPGIPPGVGGPARAGINAGGAGRPLQPMGVGGFGGRR